MRSLILKDHLIDKDECLALLDEYSDFIEKHTGIECEWYVEGYDFSHVPTTPDRDGDLKPTREYRHKLCKEIHDRYGDYGVDNIVMWVHEDNFVFKGVWGTAWSYVHFKYNFLLCRWDKDNKVNSFNTLFHEGEHTSDTLIWRELGIEIDTVIKNHFGYDSFDYDRDYVHGNHPDWQYIGRRGYERDGRMLELLAPYLRGAYSKRKEKHFSPVRAVMLEVINFVQSWIRNKKRSKSS